MGQRLAACTGAHDTSAHGDAAPIPPPPSTSPPAVPAQPQTELQVPAIPVASAADTTAVVMESAKLAQPPVVSDANADAHCAASSAGPAEIEAAVRAAAPVAAAGDDAGDTEEEPSSCDVPEAEDAVMVDSIAPLMPLKVAPVEVDPARQGGSRGLTSAGGDLSTHSFASFSESMVVEPEGSSSAPQNELLLEPGTPDRMSRDALGGAAPPPASDDLPEVSLMDIMSSGKTRVTRSRSRRASNTSMASLSAIPENVELTPLSVRADSVRLSVQALDKSHSKARDPLGDVNELDMESKSASISRHSMRHEPPSADSSPRSSISSLLNGDDSIMPPDYEYQMLMPVLAHPRAYKRLPNATEAIRSLSIRDTVFGSSAGMLPSGDGATGAPEAPPAAPPPEAPGDAPPPPAASVSSTPLLGNSPSQLERAAVATDDSGLQLLETTVLFDDGEADVELNSDQLRIIPLEEQTEPPTYWPVQQGRVQQESIKFRLPAAVQGLRCVKKYQVGEISWSQTVVMGDFDAGVHSYQFEESQVPKGSLSLGKYDMKTVFMDSHGQYLWAAVNTFEVVKKVVD